MTKAIRARGLKVLMSFHTGYHYSFPHWSGNPEYTNPAYTGLYGQVHDTDKAEVFKGSGSGQWEKQVRFPEADMHATVAMMEEAVSRCDPDIVWVDTSFGGTTGPANRGRYRNGRIVEGADSYLPGLREREQRDFLSFFFNQAARSGRQVEFVYKTLDLPPGIGMRDIENGLLDELTYDPWMTDIDMNVHVKGEHLWFYREGNPIKPAGYLINLLADIVSKNGRMLLNVPPQADGTFSPGIEHELLAIGSWLKTNGGSHPRCVAVVHLRRGDRPCSRRPGIIRTPPSTTISWPGTCATPSRVTRFTPSCSAGLGMSATFHALGSRGRLFAGRHRGCQPVGTGIAAGCGPRELILWWSNSPRSPRDHTPRC